MSDIEAIQLANYKAYIEAQRTESALWETRVSTSEQIKKIALDKYRKSLDINVTRLMPDEEIKSKLCEIRANFADCTRATVAADEILSEWNKLHQDTDLAKALWETSMKGHHPYDTSLISMNRYGSNSLCKPDDRVDISIDIQIDTPQFLSFKEHVETFVAFNMHAIKLQKLVYLRTNEHSTMMKARALEGNTYFPNKYDDEIIPDAYLRFQLDVQYIHKLDDLIAREKNVGRKLWRAHADAKAKWIASEDKLHRVPAREYIEDFAKVRFEFHKVRKEWSELDVKIKSLEASFLTPDTERDLTDENIQGTVSRLENDIRTYLEYVRSRKIAEQKYVIAESEVKFLREACLIPLTKEESSSESESSDSKPSDSESSDSE